MFDTVLLWSKDKALQIESYLVVILKEQLSDMLVVRQKGKTLWLKSVFLSTNPIIINISFGNIGKLVQFTHIFPNLSP